MRSHLPIAFLSLALAAFAQTADKPQPVSPAVTRAFPFSMVGKLIFMQGADWFQGSGTLVRPSAVLTAAHNLWNADQGFSTDLIFRRALQGEESAGDATPSRIYVLAGYRDKARSHTENDPRSFAQDLGALIFAEPVAGGSSTGWWASPALLLGAHPMIAFGYGAQFHDGTELLSVEPKGGFEQITDAFYDNRSIYFEGGMSGGPVFVRDSNGALLVSGVVVAGDDDQHGGGIRILDPTAAAFLREYMK
ncbi:MAG: trypsin-like serine protease [Chthoniobacteraceae bacterium]